MFLRSVRLENFRAYPTASLTIGPSGLVVVTGPNNAGKSALLSALDMVGGQPVDGPLLFHGSEEPCKVVADFEFTPEEKRHLASQSPEDADEIEKSLIGTSFTFADIGDAERRLGIIAIEATLAGGDSWPLAYFEPTGRGGGKLDSVDWRDWIRNWPDGPALPQSMNGTGPITRQLELNLGPYSIPRFLVEWRAGFYHFKALRQGQLGRTGTTVSDPSLDPTGSNLANHLQWLRGYKEAAWDHIRLAMAQLIPDVGLLQLRSSGSQAELGFETPAGGFENLKDIGTGVEQLLLAMTVGQTAAGSLLIVEEPETNLNPGTQRELMAHLESWSAARPIVIATHSPTIIDAAGDGGLYEVYREAGRSHVEPISRGDRDVASLLTNLGVRYSDMLSSDRILIVEGPTDRTILEAWLPQLAARNTVAIVPGGGGAGVWQVQLLEDAAKLADRLPRPLIYLRDRDELTERDLGRLRERPAIRILRRRELENYLLDPDAIAALLAEHRNDHPAPRPADIAEEMREIADGLKERVIRSRVLANAARLQRIVPVTTHQREHVFRAEDLVAELVGLVIPKFQDVLDGFEQALRAEDTRQSDLVNQEWDEHWLELVPGADLLGALFQRHGTSYSKKVDGPRLATLMQAPPEEIRDLLKDVI